MQTGRMEDPKFPENPVILIPAYNPGQNMTDFIRELSGYFGRIVVVDDGSTEGKALFDEIGGINGCKVLRHEINRGKGAALKTGFAFIGEKDTITADADGQHSIHDIVKVAKALASCRNGLVLGVREFKGDVPFRSKFGNFWTRIFFFLLTGLDVKDTQTGLRGIPSGLIERIRAIEGDRYEYEMAMLADAKTHAEKPTLVTIDTIYRDNNASSHFRPLADTVRIYRTLIARLCRQRKRRSLNCNTQVP